MGSCPGTLLSESSPNGGVNGTVRITFPTIMKQVEVSGIELTFEKGVVVKASAKESDAFLKSMIDLDSGSRYVGALTEKDIFHGPGLAVESL